jgi:Rod binding domain-containing protein
MHVTPALTPNRPPERAELREQARALETAFVAEMLKAAGTVRMQSGLEGSDDVQPFEPFLAEAQARALVAAGGLGLTDSLVAALARRTDGGAA